MPSARMRVQADGEWRSRIRRCLYRPFDERWIYWADWMIDWPRPEISGHLFAGRNISLCFSRREELPVPYGHFLASRLPGEHGLLSSKTTDYQAPLFLYPTSDGGRLEFQAQMTPNFSQSFLNALFTRLGMPLSGEHLSADCNAEDILHYIYAIVHSPVYRGRYAEFLKIDFPRLPLPGGLELFRELVGLGGELVALHLMESPKLARPITGYTGPKNPVVGRVGWLDDTVWLDAATAKKGQAATSGTIGFRGVQEEVWDFHIGGYQVCEKWLKDRKGRTLSKDNIAHYQRIVVAIAETLRSMQEIDDVIEQHGGWPDAFADTRPR